MRRISEELGAQIKQRVLPAGSRLPSVRQLARERRISSFTAAEVYNVLVAAGLLEARPGRGYFVPGLRGKVHHGGLEPQIQVDVLWEHRRGAHGRIAVDAGCGWLPADWLYVDGVRRALRAVARHPGLAADGYGNPYGLAELRSHLAGQLRLRGIEAREEQIVLTQGASQALDLIVRYGLSPGDAVIVEDPGYPPLFELLRARGVKLLSLPRRGEGPDVVELERLLKTDRPRLLFTNTTCQNPTGTSTRVDVAHRILELADTHGFGVVEDDIFAELVPRTEATLAALDQFRRVCYVASLSKTIAPGLRVGYLVASAELAEKIARGKMMSSMASSDLMERVALEVLTDGHYRRHLERLRMRLAAAQITVAQALEGQGVEIAYKPTHGMFLWGRLPSRESVGHLWKRALDVGVLLAPGELFRPEGQATPYWRFNVAHSDSPPLYEFVESVRRSE